MRSFQDLKVWQKMHQLTLRIYEVTRSYPQDEKFGLVDQLRRSSSSVATNIVEGFKRESGKEQQRFFNVAESSLEETKYQLILSKDLNYLEVANFEGLFAQAEEVGRMLHGFRQAIRKRTSSSSLLLNP